MLDAIDYKQDLPMFKGWNFRFLTGFGVVVMTVGFVGMNGFVAQKAFAQEQAKQKEDASEPQLTATHATVEKVMEQAVQNIAHRYNLNAEQTEYTHELMTREVMRFLKEHEKEVWPVLRDLLAVQLKGRPPDGEKAGQLGKATLPLFELAKKAILEANDEWRFHLTEEQRKLHDFDLMEMSQTFEEMDHNFKEWTAGRVTDMSIFPPPPARGKEPRRPARPEDGKLPDPLEIGPSLTVFDLLVDRFLREHTDLDQGQKDSARSILEEYKAKAVDFQNAHKAELTKVAVDRREAVKQKDQKAKAEAEKRRNTILAPFLILVSEMEARLEGLLTTVQRERHAKSFGGGRESQGAKGQEVRKITSGQADKVNKAKQGEEKKANDSAKNDSTKKEDSSKSDE